MEAGRPETVRKKDLEKMQLYFDVKNEEIEADSMDAAKIFILLQAAGGKPTDTEIIGALLYQAGKRKGWEECLSEIEA